MSKLRIPSMLGARVLLLSCAMTTALPVLGLGGPKNGQSGMTHLVEINGLKSVYPSCAKVDFSIRNISKSDLVVEIYAERLRSGVWSDEQYPYAINDPESLYRKTVKADVLKPDGSLRVSYDRCLKPKFETEDESTFKKGIAAKDEKGSAKVQQRFRIEVLVRGTNEGRQKIWSAPFERVTEGLKQ